MPILRNDMLARARSRRGFEGAVIVDSKSGERVTRIRKGPRSSVSVTRISPRRVAWRGPDGKLTPVDTDWKPGPNGAAWRVAGPDYQMEIPQATADDFRAGVMFRYQRGPINFRFTPADRLFWRNEGGETQTIRNSRSVAARRGRGRNQSIVTWPRAYGVGIDMQLVMESEMAFKRLRVDRISRFGTSDLSGNSHFVQPVKFDTHADAILHYFDTVADRYVPWDGVTETRTDRPLVFRNPAGEFLYRLAVPFILSPTGGVGPEGREIRAGTQRDQKGRVIARLSWFVLRQDNGSRVIDLCFDHDWLQKLPGAFFLDPFVDLVPDDTDDGEYNTYGSITSTKNFSAVGNYASGKVYWWAYVDIGTAGIVDTDTIDDAIIDIRVASQPVGTDLEIEVVELADAPVPTTNGEADTAIGNWGANSANWGRPATTGRQDTVDFAAGVQDAIDAGGTVGYLGVWINPIGTNSVVSTLYNVGYGAAYEPSIEITHTAGASGGPVARRPLGARSSIRR